MRDKKASTKGLLKTSWANERKENWHIFTHQRVCAMGAAVSDYCLTARRHTAIQLLRDLVFARAHKSRRRVVGRLYRDNAKSSPLPVYVCRTTRNKAGKVGVHKSRINS